MRWILSGQHRIQMVSPVRPGDITTPQMPVGMTVVTVTESLDY